MTDERLSSTLGQRILEASRMATLMHLSQLRQEASNGATRATRQQVTGGAGDTRSTDGVLAASYFFTEARGGQER